MNRVLIVDDNLDLAAMMRAALEACGLEVMIAGDGRRALAMQRAAPADIVVTDIFMPEMDGIETIAALKEEFPRTAIIAMTAGSKVGKVDYPRVACVVGASACLKKPFHASELIAAVRDALVAAEGVCYVNTSAFVTRMRTEI